MNPIIEQISKIGIVPVIALDDAQDAEPLAQALIRGGLACAEVTFRTDAAEEAIRIMAQKFPDMLVGAGTVLSVEQADQAMEAGAKFIVSPGFHGGVVRHCMEKGYPVLPGISNPSEVGKAMDLGVDVVKFFPAEQSGGIAMIKAMSAPYSKMKFMPTGGISAKNLRDYLDFNKIVACGGSWMVKKDLVSAGQFDRIEEMTREAVASMLGFEIDLLGGLEESKVTKQPNMRIFTKDMRRAIYHLENKGAKFDYDSCVRDEKENIMEIYLKEQLGGYTLCLVQR